MRRVSAVVAMLVGALLIETSLLAPLTVAAVLALLTWLLYVPAARRAA